MCVDRGMHPRLSTPLTNPPRPPQNTSIAFLNFGLMSTGSIQLAAGILLAADGIFMLVATFKYPSLFQGNAPPEGQQAAPSHATAAVAVKGPGNV